MKKIYNYTFAALSIASLGLTSCEISDVQGEDNQEKQVRVSQVTLRGGYGAPFTKIAIEKGWNLSWEDGEQLAGYSVDSYNQYWSDPSDWFPTDNSALNVFTASNVSADGNYADFTGDRVDDCELRLVYPYDSSKGAKNFGFDYDIDLESVEVDPNADLYATAKDGMCLVSSDADITEGESFVMEHVTSYIDWQISSNDNIEINSIELVPSAESSVEIPISAELDLSEDCDDSGFYSEDSYGSYSVNFSSPLSINAESKNLYSSILPFTFTAGESIDVIVYFTADGAECYQTITKTNETGSDIVFEAGEYNVITCEVLVASAVKIAAAEITEAKVQDIEINCAKLSITSENAVEIGYMIEESEDFADVEVDADYVIKHLDYKATPAESLTFTEPYVFDVNYLSPTKEYTIYVYAKNVNGDAIISDAIVFNAAAIKEVSLTQGAITATSVSFTPSYDVEYFNTVAYDVFLAENEDKYSESFVKSYGTIIHNQDEVTVDGLEPGKDYIIRLVGEVKPSYNSYYTHSDLSFTTDELSARGELASAQVFGNSQAIVTSTSYNRTNVVFTNDVYEISFEFKSDANYAPGLPVGDYTLFDGSIKDIVTGETVECIDESTLSVSALNGVYSFSGKMLTAQISDPISVNDNKYLDFSCDDAVINFPVDIATSSALYIPADKALSFFIDEGQYSSEYGLYLVFNEELSPELTSISAAEGSYIQRYQAGAGNVLVEGECIYDIATLTFDVEYDADSEDYKLSNGVGSTADYGSFVVEKSLYVDPTNVAAQEVAVTLSEITSASGESEGSGSGWDESWESVYSLSFASDEFSEFSIEITTDDEEDSSSVFPTLKCEDGEGSWSTTDDVKIACVTKDNETLAIKNSEIVNIEKSGDNYSVTIKFTSTSNNTNYTATYNGAMYSGYSCEINDYTSDDGGWGW